MKNSNHSPNLPPEGVDRLLGEYFRSQMPKPWPGAPKTGTIRPAQKLTASTDTLTSSRWALAASVVCLLIGCWYVSAQSNNGKPRTTTNLDSSTANSKVLNDLSKKSR